MGETTRDDLSVNELAALQRIPDELTPYRDLGLSWIMVEILLHKCVIGFSSVNKGSVWRLPEGRALVQPNAAQASDEPFAAFLHEITTWRHKGAPDDTAVYTLNGVELTIVDFKRAAELEAANAALAAENALLRTLATTVKQQAYTRGIASLTVGVADAYNAYIMGRPLGIDETNVLK